MVCDSRPPSGPSTISGRANSVMPRLAIHSLVPRSLWTSAHSASNVPIITKTAAPITTAPANGRMRRRSTASRRLVGSIVSCTRTRATTGNSSSVAAADDEERRGDAERPDQHGRDRRAEGEAEHVRGEQPTEVRPEVVGIGEDHDAPDGRRRGADADAADETADQDRQQRGAEGHQHEAEHVDGHPDQHDPAGVTAVGAAARSAAAT